MSVTAMSDAAGRSPGLAALRDYFAAPSELVVAVVGPGASRPLYPAGTDLVLALVDACARVGLADEIAATCRSQAAAKPDSVVEILRREVGGRFPALVRSLLSGRRDPATGFTWTPLQELVCRLPVDGVVTTGFDSGLLDARIRVRTGATATGFATWSEGYALDRWRNRDVFADDELPILYAHGVASRPDEVVLATTEYRRAYAGRLSEVLADLITGAHLLWVGFDADDPAIAAVEREVFETQGRPGTPGGPPRHVVLQPWTPGDGDPAVLRRMAELEHGADLVLCSSPEAVLSELADPRFPAARTITVVAAPDAPPASSSGVGVTWGTAVDPVAHFTGRTEELARVDRWAADPSVRLVGVSAWGGAGKTALVGEWVARHAAAASTRSPGSTSSSGALQGGFGWSFYANASTDEWARAVLAWAAEQLGLHVVSAAPMRAAEKVLYLLARVPVLLVLDGLEVTQEGPAGGSFGKFLDPMLREVLAGVCRLNRLGCRSLVLLTSRFPFADLEGFYGTSARMLELPAFTPSEGAKLLSAAGGAWLSGADREDLAAAVDGHALALSVLGELLAQRVTTGDLGGLREELLAAASTDAKVAKVLSFYGDRLSDADRHLVAAVSLFAHPVSPEAVLAVAAHETLSKHLTGWTTPMVADAVTGRLAGLLTRHPDGTLSAHPLVRDTFRPLALTAAELATETDLARIPEQIRTREDGLRVVEAIELLLEADQWAAADDLYGARTNDGELLRALPAAGLGQRAAGAFVGLPSRRAECVKRLDPFRMGYYLAAVGINAESAGDLETALSHMHACVEHTRGVGDSQNLGRALANLADCLAYLGRFREARQAAMEALDIQKERNDLANLSECHAYLAWLSAHSGETSDAERHFVEADRYKRRETSTRRHLTSYFGVLWAEHLARTGRPSPARVLSHANRRISAEAGWQSDVARCERVLAQVGLNEDVAVAHKLASGAATTFREGEYVTELAETLPVLADAARGLGDLDDALDHADEAVDLAGPRGLLPVQITALAARGRVHLDRGDGSLARDDADTALSLARRHRLPWHELDALDVLAALDPPGGWGDQADALRRRLIPPGLDPDPLKDVS